MQSILSVTVPFFALVAFGYLAAHRGALPESAIPGLNAFVLYFALPAMLLRFGMNTPVLELLNPAIIALYLLAALTMVALTVFLTLSERIHLKDASFGAMVAAFPNAGFMGVPLMVALIGPQAAGPIITTILIDVFFTTSACIALAHAYDLRGKAGPAKVIAMALLAPLRNPLPWAISIGALMSAMSWTLPGALNVIVKMLSDAASPVALFAIGAVLWRSGKHAHSRTPWPQVVPVVVLKLLVHPLLVFGLFKGAQSMGGALAEHLSDFQVMVLTLGASLPSASNVAMLAEHYKADAGRVARIIMLSTVLAFASFSLLAWWFEVQPVV